MKISEQMQSLEIYINHNLSETKESKYHNESFCLLVLDYYGSKGEFSKEDVEFLSKNDYSVEDFTDK